MENERKEISTFLKKLYPYIRLEGETQPAFVRRFFSLFIGYRKVENITSVNEYKDEYIEPKLLQHTDKKYENIYNGSRMISVDDLSYLLQKANKRIFVDILEGMMKTNTVDNLIDVMYEYYDYVDRTNCISLIFELLKILLKRVTDSSVRLPNNGSIKYANTNLQQADKEYLFIESEGQCPLCNNSLFISKDSILAKNYYYFNIIPEAESQIENTIILCSNCIKKLTLNYTKKDRTRLLNIKELKLCKVRNQIKLNNIHLEDEIIKIIDVLSENIVNFDDEDLIYQPVEIKNKIKTEKLLLHKVSNYVSFFFNKIDKIIKKYNSSDELNQLIKLAYIRIRKNNVSQSTIYNELVNWIEEKSKCTKESCEAIVSYYIQKCEVFENEIS